LYHNYQTPTAIPYELLNSAIPSKFLKIIANAAANAAALLAALAWAYLMALLLETTPKNNASLQQIANKYPPRNA
jgi:hypothetical protein